MNRCLSLAAFLLAGVALALAPTAAAPEAPAVPGKRIVAYYAEWTVYQRKYNVHDIHADKLTHIIYAFAKIAPGGECGLFDSYAALDKFYPGDSWDAGSLRGNFNQLLKLKKKHPRLKTLIAVGGWTLSGPFSDVALTDKSRDKFAKSAVAFMTKYGFDGVDVDWEHPVSGGLERNKTRPEDKKNYTLLLASLRKELDARGKLDKKRYLLTLAAPAGPKTYANLEIEKVGRLVDWVNLMAYDFHGGWSTLTNFNAPLYPSKGDPTADEVVRKHFNVDSAVRAYLAKGMPADKIVLGVPFYGRGWGGVKNLNDGLYQPHAPNPPRGTWEPGTWDYKDLAANHVGKSRRFWHDEAKVPWLYDAKSGTMISYDDPESLRLKAEYAERRKLGGVMAWELSADDAKATLLTTLHKALRGKK